MEHITKAMEEMLIEPVQTERETNRIETEVSKAGNNDKLLCHCNICHRDYWDKKVNGFFYQNCPYCQEVSYDYLRKEKIQEKVERIERIRQTCGLEEHMLLKTFENYDTMGDRERKKAKDKIEEYAEKLPYGKGLYIFGGVGSGKTHLATAIVHKAIRKELKIFYTTFGDMCRDIRSANDKIGISEYEAIERYTNPDILLLDDLGKEKPTEWNISVLFNVINTLYNNKKRLIITTNYTIKNLMDKLTPVGDDGETLKAIESRFYEMLIPVKMAFPDYRKLGWE